MKKKLSQQEKIELAQELYQKVKGKIEGDWTKNQFISWCRKKIKSNNPSLKKNQETAPFIYWNLTLINEDLPPLEEGEFFTNKNKEDEKTSQEETKKKKKKKDKSDE